MIEIKHREFARSACKMMKSPDPLKIVTAEGLVVGFWFPAKFEQKAEAAATIQAERELPVRKEELVYGNPSMCEKCEKHRAEYTGDVWHEGDVIKVKICEKCYVQFKPKGFKKINEK